MKSKYFLRLTIAIIIIVLNPFIVISTDYDSHQLFDIPSPAMAECNEDIVIGLIKNLWAGMPWQFHLTQAFQYYTL